jgi:hypothetical protein
MRNVLDESCTENQNTFSVEWQFIFPENRVIYDIMWKNMVQPVRRLKTTYDPWALQFWITKGTNIHSEYVIIIAFPQQQCLRERAWMSLLYVDLNWLFGLVVKTSLSIRVAISRHGTVSVQHEGNYPVQLNVILRLKTQIFCRIPLPSTFSRTSFFSRKTTALISTNYRWYVLCN